MPSSTFKRKLDDDLAVESSFKPRQYRHQQQRRIRRQNQQEQNQNLRYRRSLSSSSISLVLLHLIAFILHSPVTVKAQASSSSSTQDQNYVICTTGYNSDPSIGGFDRNADGLLASDEFIKMVQEDFVNGCLAEYVLDAFNNFARYIDGTVAVDMNIVSANVFCLVLTTAIDWSCPTPTISPTQAPIVDATISPTTTSPSTIITTLAPTILQSNPTIEDTPSPTEPSIPTIPTTTNPTSSPGEVINTSSPSTSPPMTVAPTPPSTTPSEPLEVRLWIGIDYNDTAVASGIGDDNKAEEQRDLLTLVLPAFVVATVDQIIEEDREQRNNSIIVQAIENVINTEVVPSSSYTWDVINRLSEDDLIKIYNDYESSSCSGTLDFCWFAIPSTTVTVAWLANSTDEETATASIWTQLLIEETIKDTIELLLIESIETNRLEAILQENLDLFFSWKEEQQQVGIDIKYLGSNTRPDVEEPTTEAPVVPPPPSSPSLPTQTDPPVASALGDGENEEQQGGTSSAVIGIIVAIVVVAIVAIIVIYMIRCRRSSQYDREGRLINATKGSSSTSSSPSSLPCHKNVGNKKKRSNKTSFSFPFLQFNNDGKGSVYSGFSSSAYNNNDNNNHGNSSSGSSNGNDDNDDPSEAIARVACHDDSENGRLIVFEDPEVVFDDPIGPCSGYHNYNNRGGGGQKEDTSSMRPVVVDEITRNDPAMQKILSARHRSDDGGDSSSNDTDTKNNVQQHPSILRFLTPPWTTLERSRSKSRSFGSTRGGTNDTSSRDLPEYQDMVDEDDEDEHVDYLRDKGALMSMDTEEASATTEEEDDRPATNLPMMTFMAATEEDYAMTLLNTPKIEQQHEQLSPPVTDPSPDKSFASSATGDSDIYSNSTTSESPSSLVGITGRPSLVAGTWEDQTCDTNASEDSVQDLGVAGLPSHLVRDGDEIWFVDGEDDSLDNNNGVSRLHPSGLRKSSDSTGFDVVLKERIVNARKNAANQTDK